ncbi:MAG: DEAD/DEAH box helicase family protein [Bacilli bacterium]|nr:DEAD/DEAH box helicase family protein [bacterium]MDY2696651.1 DEAD/DEAH box helicase family protein [Bacilli bacterium]
MSDVFDIEKSNVYEDQDNYYFFRALNLSDCRDADDGVITNNAGLVNRVRTNRERYTGESRYTSSSVVSLEEVTDHIKIHQSKTTNCISLTSNANTAITYGRGYYRDRYILVKVPKKELGSKVFQAGPYMLDEISKAINEILEGKNETEREKYKKLFSRIDECQTSDSLEALKQLLAADDLVSLRDEAGKEDSFVDGLDFNITKSVDYNALDEEANLEKNKTILKLDILGEQILPRISNKLLVATVGGAFSSSELIHYGNIEFGELREIPKEAMDVLSLLQQMPSDLEYIDEIKDRVLNCVSTRIFSGEFHYSDFSLVDSYLSIDNMYEVFGNGRVSYGDARELYRKAYYLAKSRLRAINSVSLLNTILDNDPKYSETLEYIARNGYGIEPEITTRVSKDLVTVSESVSLDIGNKDIELVNYINSLSKGQLSTVLNHPNDAIEAFADSHFFDDFSRHTVDKKEYIADSLIDLLDLSKFGVKFNLSPEQREDIKNRILEFNLEGLYSYCSSNGVSEKELARIVFTNLIKGTKDFNTKDTFTLEELEWFIGYNTIKDTNIKLLAYQRPIIRRIKEKYEDKQFTAAVMPTGTGKTYISLAMMNEFEKIANSLSEDNHAKILYLAPNVEILDQLKRTIRKAYHPEEHLGQDIDTVIKKVFPNLVLSTYQNLADNSSIGIGPDGKKEIILKEDFREQFDFIVLDELHRTGAPEWYSSIGMLLDSQDEKTKILGISATPERDVDFKDMTDFWARKYDYSEDEILLGEQMAYNMDLIKAIDLGLVNSPVIINCLYSLIADGTMDDLELSIDDLLDEDIKRAEKAKYEKLRRNVETSDGIEKIIGDNIKEGSKFIVFLPVTRRDDGTFVDDDGEEIEGSKASQIIKDYQTLFMQYLYANKYFNEHAQIYDIYDKLVAGEVLDNEEISYLESEKNNLLLLSRVSISYKPMALNTQIEEISSTIISSMGWEALDKNELATRLNEVMGDEVENYSMLGEYSNGRNKSELYNFSNSSSKKKKLMFVINKLNEGVHVEDVDGIVWLRALNDNSRILFQQQLGRCIRANLPGRQAKTPIVLDLVNNTVTVKLKKGELQEFRDLSNLDSLMDWIDGNNRIPNINSEDITEYEYAKFIKVLQARYIKYFDEEVLQESKNTLNIQIIKSILSKGAEIGLWDVEILTENGEYTDDIKKNLETNYSFIGRLQVSSEIHDFLELQGAVASYELTDLEIKFEENYKILARLDELGLNTNLSKADKVLVNEDGSLEVISYPSAKDGKPSLSTINGRKETEAEWNERKRKYYSDQAKAVGDWLYRNYSDLDEDKKEALISLGYLNGEEYLKYKGMSAKEKFEKDFEENYQILVKLNDLGLKTNLSKADKVLVNEDGSLEVISEPRYKNGKPSLSTINGRKETEAEWDERKRKYNSDEAKAVGYWLCYNYYKLSLKKRGDLQELGYLNGEEYLKYKGMSAQEKFEKAFEENYQILVKLNDLGLKTNLSATDKVLVNEDGNLEVISCPTAKDGKPCLSTINGRKETETEWNERKRKYYSDEAKAVGYWLYDNYHKLSLKKRGDLQELGYLNGEEYLKHKGMSAKEKFERVFEENYKILVKLNDLGLKTNLSNSDKVLVNEDGNLEVISKPSAKNGKPCLSTINGRKETEAEWDERKRKYYSDEAQAVGSWLYKNYHKFSPEKREKLQELGYLNGEESLKKKAEYAKKKADFNSKSTFGKVVTEVSKGALDNKDTDAKAGAKK